MYGNALFVANALLLLSTVPPAPLTNKSTKLNLLKHPYQIKSLFSLCNFGRYFTFTIQFTEVLLLDSLFMPDDCRIPPDNIGQHIARLSLQYCRNMAKNQSVQLGRFVSEEVGFVGECHWESRQTRVHLFDNLLPRLVEPAECAKPPVYAAAPLASQQPTERPRVHRSVARPRHLRDERFI